MILEKLILQDLRQNHQEVIRTLNSKAFHTQENVIEKDSRVVYFVNVAKFIPVEDINILSEPVSELKKCDLKHAQSLDQNFLNLIRILFAHAPDRVS